MTEVPESDDVAAHQYRLAQMNRLLRLARAEGLDEAEVVAGREMPVGIDGIVDERGRIVPEREDYEAVASGLD
jgi:hypothetical protein